MKTKATLTTLLIATPLFIGGCMTDTWLGLGAPTTALPTMGGGAVAASYGMGATLRHGHYGPRVSVKNESGSEIALRMWVAKVDNREADGFSDMRTDEDLALVLEPGAEAVRRPNKKSWATARTDAVVWVQWTTLDGGSGTNWIAFDRPGPFELVLADGESGVVVDTDRTSAHAPVPSELLIVGRVGEHPIWDSSDAGI